MSRRISAARRIVAAWRGARDGAMALEFALITPLVLLVTVGIFETIFLISDIHTASEATRRGARIALIEDPIASLSQVAGGTDVICTGSGGSVQCTGGSLSGQATFTAIVAAMRQIAPWLQESNVRVSYTRSGIDTAANLLTPLITVEIVGAIYQPKATSPFALDFAVPLPTFETSQVGPTIVLN